MLITAIGLLPAHLEIAPTIDQPAYWTPREDLTLIARGTLVRQVLNMGQLQVTAHQITTKGIYMSVTGMTVLQGWDMGQVQVQIGMAITIKTVLRMLGGIQALEDHFLTEVGRVRLGMTEAHQFTARVVHTHTPVGLGRLQLFHTIAHQQVSIAGLIVAAHATQLKIHLLCRSKRGKNTTTGTITITGSR